MDPKTPAEIELMRSCGKKLASILDRLASQVKPGITPKEIASFAAKLTKESGLNPVLLGYQGYSDVMCVSVNDQIVHGIPGNVPFKDGDIVKLDLTLAEKGMITDAAVTVVAGNPKLTADTARLIEGTKKALNAAIGVIKGDGTRVGDISAAAQEVLDRYGLGIVRDLVGHGVGHSVHEKPNVPNYGARGTGPVLHAGDTIAIEPMASLGDYHIKVGKDGWTVSMADGSLSAHFEHTVLITDDGAEILTA